MVPCPAMIFSSLYGGTMTYPCWAASCFGLVLALVGAGADEDDFGAEFGGGFTLDQRGVVRASR